MILTYLESGKMKKNVIIVVMLLIYMFTLSGCGVFEYHADNEMVETNDVSEYISYMSTLDISDTKSDFVLYPRTGLEDMNIEECYFYSENGLFDTYYQMYMKCVFTETAYVEEVDRLSTIEINREDEVYRPILVKDAFAFPAYVSIATEFDYEYALLDSTNNSIIYVFNRIADMQSGKIPLDYLPQKNSIQEIDSEYNMYYSDLNLE